MDAQRVSSVGGAVSRRSFVKGTLGAGAALGLAFAGLDNFFDLGEAFADTATVALPSSGTAPEQVHLTVGDNPNLPAGVMSGAKADPATSITVSWLAPGTQPQPAPGLSYSSQGPISAANPGTAATVVPVSFQDQMNLETAYVYHAPLTGLTPGTIYYYEITDGASLASTVTGQFSTALGDTARTPFRFSSFGDLATPVSNNKSGTFWAESSDNAAYAVAAIAALSPQPVVHLLNGDLCYANLNYNSQPAVWRDFFVNLQQSAGTVPWMPCLGNHEIEFGSTVGANGQAIYNGANGYGTYLSRFDLPGNGISGLEGNFYSFQVGTVLFISLDADDVIYQDGGAAYTPPSLSGGNKVTSAGSVAATSGSGTPTAVYPPLTPSTAGTGVSIPPGSSVYNNQYTGTLAVQDDGLGQPASLVPSGSSPNKQTQWLASTLAAARQGGTTSNALYPSKLPIDMIVVQMHQCALSSSQAGNGSDLGIRQAWLPLFEQYKVDLVVSGHEHNYERSYAVKGYVNGLTGTVGATGSQANPNQSPGTKVFTRQPQVVTSAQGTAGGNPSFDTSQGTVFLVLGGGGVNGPTDVYLVDSNGNPAARVITERNEIYQTSTGTWTKNGADSVESAPWSARRDGASYTGSGTSPAIGNSWGFAVFDVNPGAAPGDTVITMNYYDAGAASGGADPYQGTTKYSATPLETIVFTHPAVQPPSALPEFPSVVGAGVAAAALAGGAVYLAGRRGAGDPETVEP